MGRVLGAPAPPAGGRAPPARNPPAHRPTVGGGIEPFETGQIEKALVDGIDVLAGGKPAEHRHQPGAEVGVQRIVAGQGDDPMPAGQVPALEPRGTHREAEGFCFRGAGHHDAVVVSE